MKKSSAYWLSVILSASLLLCSCAQPGQGKPAPASTAGTAAAETTAGTAAETTAGNAGTAAAETTAGAVSGTAAETAAGSEGSASGTSPEETAAGETQSSGQHSMEQVIEAPRIKAADFPVTDGSTATLPLAWMLYRLCTGEDQAAAEQVMEFTKTNNAYIRLMDKEADLVIAYEPGPNAQEDPRYKDLELKPIGLDALVFLCNTANPVASLTSSQLKDIYTGKIRNWKDLGGEDVGIIAFQREMNSGSQTLMEKFLMKGTPMMDAPGELRPGEMGELVDSVARYSNTNNALGYSVYYYARNMYQRPNLRFMAADGIAPSPESIRKGDYPYVNPFYAAVRKDEPENTKARQLFDWLTGEDGQSLVEAMGYVSMEKAEKQLPPDLDGRVSLETGRLEGNTRRLAISGAAFDGDAGVVILDENFQVAKRIDGITIRGDEDLARIRGSVFPAGLILYSSADAAENESVTDSIGLYDVDRDIWAVAPGSDYCHTECLDGEHAVYYMGAWPEWYDENGNGITVTMHYDDDIEKNSAVVKQNGKVVAESSSMTIRPFMVDESNEDYLPYGWWVIMMTNSGLDADGEPFYQDTGFLITDRDGNIVYREDKSSSYSLSQVDENFCVLYDWNSGKYIIRDYSGRELFSWIRPETYEFW